MTSPEERTRLQLSRGLRQVLAATGRIKGEGFSRFDAEFGAHLARTDPARWTEKQAWGAWQLAGRYRRQFAALGIQLEALRPPGVPTPPKAPERKVMESARREDGTVVLRVRGSDGPPKGSMTVPGAVWLDGAWSAPPGEEARQLAVRLLGEEFEASDALLAWICREPPKVAPRPEPQAHLPEAFSRRLGRSPRPFQEVGALWLSGRKRAMLADEPGLGKTGQALMALELADAWPAVAVTPSSAKYVWAGEAQVWLPHRSVYVVGQGDVPPGFDLYVVNYDLLFKRRSAEEIEAQKRAKRRHFNSSERTRQLLELRPKALVLDESHRVKNPSAARTKIAVDMAERAEVVWLLTGTPATSRPLDLAGQLLVAGELDGEFGGYWPFVKRYCGAVKKQLGRKTIWDLNGATHVDELHRRLAGRFMLRRRKVDVAPELPERSSVRVEVELTHPARLEYDAAVKDVVTWAVERMRRSEETRALLRDAINERHQKIILKDLETEKRERTLAAEALIKLGALKTISAKGKLAAAQDWIENFRESGESLVVFGVHLEPLRELARRLESRPENGYGSTSRGAPIIEGSVSAERRAEIQREFQAGRIPVLLLQLQTGGESITLTRSSNVLFLEHGWTPGEHDQATDRVHRIGQRDAVTAWYLIGRGTIDSEIHSAIEAARRTVARLVDGGGAGGAEASVAMRALGALVEGVNPGD